MQCPTCPTLLLTLEVGPLELDECPRCLGMWFDKGELQGMLSRALDATRSLQQRYLPPTGEEQVPHRAACPRCVSGRLVAREEGGHQIAGCTRCSGAWIPGTLLSYILSVEDVPEDVAELAATPPPLPLEEGPAPHEGKSVAPAALSAVAPALPEPAPAPEVPLAAAPSPRASPSASGPQSAAVAGRCLACSERFRPVRHAGQAFHRCEGCEALYFPRGGLPQFLAHQPKGWRPPLSLTAPEPELERRCTCPGCDGLMSPMRWQNQSVRVWACETCWSTFVSAEGVRRFVEPEKYQDPTSGGGAAAMWRAFDRFTDWLVKPPRNARHHFRYLRGGRYQ